MKRHITFLFLLLFAVPIFSQKGSFEPLKTSGSPVFGKDIVINDQPSQNQRVVDVCSAFNGWLFSAHTYKNIIGEVCVSIFKSIDNGITWTQFMDGTLGLSDITFSRIDIISTGDELQSLKIFLGFVYQQQSTGNFGEASVLRYNGNTGQLESEILNLTAEFDIYDLSLACDYPFPANNSNPSSIAVLYSTFSGWITDSLIFLSSSNGGESFDTRRIVTISNKKIRQVSLCYGTCPSFSNGRYFAAWEEKNDAVSSFGHIYTSHTEPYYNSQFTAPKCLDSLDSSLINKCRNPIIACQVNNEDNDSANLTEVVMFEKYNSPTNIHDLLGYYNKKALATNNFYQTNIAVSSHNEIQPNLVFNPYDNTFYISYFDSTIRKLPLLANSLNIENPNNWTTISSGYNDSANFISPNPKISINVSEEKVCQVWEAQRQTGKGVAMFDAVYSTYTDINNHNDACKMFTIFPNPGQNETCVEFKTDRTGIVTLDLYNIIGNCILSIPSRTFPQGTHKLSLNISTFPSGYYIVKLNINGTIMSRNLVITN